MFGEVCQGMVQPDGVVDSAADRSLSARLKKIDREHEVLLSMQDYLLTALNQHFRKKTIEKMVRILKMYVKFHFDLEEETMALCHYDQIVEHTREHKVLLSDMKQIETAFNNGVDVYESLRKLFLTLANHHIKKSDDHFIQYARTLL